MYAGQTFPKSSRLLTKGDFASLRKGAAKVDVPFLRAFVKNRKPDAFESRMGIGVGRKVGGAVLRNRLKRIVRERFRLSEIRNRGLDILVTVHPGFAQRVPKGTRGAVLTKSLNALFKKAAG